MKKIKLLTLAAFAMMVTGAWAQTDVTSTYLTNADFSADEAIAVHLCGYQGDIAKTANLYDGQNALYWAQGVTDWTPNVVKDGCAGAVFAYGSDQQLKGNSKSAPALNPQGEATGKALGFFAVWTSTVQYTKEVTLLAGEYTMTITYYNQSGTSEVTNLFGFEATSGTNYYGSTKSFATGSWKEEVVTFKLTAETAGKISLGYKAPNSGSGSCPMLFIDNVTLTYVAPSAIAPESINLSQTDVQLTKSSPSATLTASVLPAEAEQDVTWTSSDPNVVIVENGVITAVGAGSTTIVVESAFDATVKKTVTVEVEGTVLETALPSASYFNDGPIRNKVSIVGVNLIKNGAFEYWPNSFEGWTNASDFASALPADKFNVVEEDGNAYLVGSVNEGSSASGSIGTAWEIEADKTYTFTYRVKSLSSVAGEQGYLVTSLTNEKGTETAVLGKPVLTAGEWTTFSKTFTNTEGYAYLQVKFRWLSGQFGFDDFCLVEVENSVEGNVDYITENIPTTNVGTGAFQFSQANIDAAQGLVQGTATVEDVQAAYDKMTLVNAPADGQLFAVVLKATEDNWAHDNKAITYIAGGRNDAGLYAIQYKEAANTNLAQAFTFTRVSGNNYKMSQIDADGEVRYLCTGTVYDGNNNQIRTTTNADDALEVTVIPTADEGVWNLYNTAANNFIGSQDEGVFTVDRNKTFNIVETTKPSITINTTAAGWGTVMLPFAVSSLPEGVKAYTVSSLKADEKELNLSEVTALEANKPYIIEGTWNETLTGDAQGTALTYTEGWLTGVYAETLAPAASYVLQNNNDLVAFYRVEADNEPTVGANRAYLTVPGSEGVKAFFFPGLTTAIQGVFSEVANGNIHDLQGRKVRNMQKGGVYVINGQKVIIK